MMLLGRVGVGKGRRGLYAGLVKEYVQEARTGGYLPIRRAYLACRYPSRALCAVVAFKRQRAFSMITSTRLFRLRPWSVRFDAIGSVSPRARVVIRRGATLLRSSSVPTDLARESESL